MERAARDETRRLYVGALGGVVVFNVAGLLANFDAYRIGPAVMGTGFGAVLGAGLTELGHQWVDSTKTIAKELKGHLRFRRTPLDDRI